MVRPSQVAEDATVAVPLANGLTQGASPPGRVRQLVLAVDVPPVSFALDEFGVGGGRTRPRAKVPLADPAGGDFQVRPTLTAVVCDVVSENATHSLATASNTAPFDIGFAHLDREHSPAFHAGLVQPAATPVVVAVAPSGHPETLATTELTPRLVGRRAVEWFSAHATWPHLFLAAKQVTTGERTESLGVRVARTAAPFTGDHTPPLRRRVQSMWLECNLYARRRPGGRGCIR